MVSEIVPSQCICSLVCRLHPPTASTLEMGLPVSAGNRKSGGGMLCSNWKRRCLFFQHCKVTSYHPPHEKLFCFRFESRSLLAGSFPAWQQLKSVTVLGLPTLVRPGLLCAKRWTHSLYFGPPVKYSQTGICVLIWQTFLGAITAGKKLKLMRKTSIFTNQIVLRRKRSKITHSTNLALCYQAHGAASDTNESAVCNLPPSL